MLKCGSIEELRMLERTAVLAVMIALAGCSSVEPVGRSSQRGPAPAPVAREVQPQTQAALPPPAPSSQPAAPAPLVTPPQAAPAQAAPAPTPQAAPPEPTPTGTASAEDDDAIVVPGQREMQVRPPDGDPRSMGERMEDVRAWDQCVTSVQSAFERDPMRPQLDTPEEYCSRSLGMASRTAVPASRRR
jgi:hypothetical protein